MFLHPVVCVDSQGDAAVCVHSQDGAAVHVHAQVRVHREPDVTGLDGATTFGVFVLPDDAGAPDIRDVDPKNGSGVAPLLGAPF